jgi:hypothetical protein
MVGAVRRGEAARMSAQLTPIHQIEGCTPHAAAGLRWNGVRMLRTLLLSAALATTAFGALSSPAVSAAATPSIKLVSKSLKIDDKRRVAVKVRCASSRACTGTMRLQLGNGSDKHPKRYEVAAGRTATIKVGVTPTAKRKIMDGAKTAVVTLTESDGDESKKTLPIRL